MDPPPRISQLDHVAVVVEDTDAALPRFSSELGLRVVHSEELKTPHVRLTYIDAGNAYIQLVEPLDPSLPIARDLAEHGEGLHHICFGVDDPIQAAACLGRVETGAVNVGSGRGHRSAFVPGPARHGVRIEFTGSGS